MQETYSLFQELEWFISPISSFFKFFFASKVGIALSIIAFLIFLLTNLLNDVWVRRLQYGRVRVPSLEKTYMFLRSIGNSISTGIVKISLLLGLILFFALIGSLNNSIGRINTVINELEKNKEIRNMIRQINQNYKIAEIRIIKQKLNEVTKSVSSDIEIKYFNINGMDNAPSKQNITLAGSDFYIQATDINVEFSELSADGCKSLTIPLKIFSNEVPAESGINLKIMDNEGFPYFYRHSDDEIFGMTPEVFRKNMKDLLNLMSDKEAANEKSIRIQISEKTHHKLWENNAVQLWVTRNGGISLRNFVTY